MGVCILQATEYVTTSSTFVKTSIGSTLDHDGTWHYIRVVPLCEHAGLQKSLRLASCMRYRGLLLLLLLRIADWHCILRALLLTVRASIAVCQTAAAHASVYTAHTLLLLTITASFRATLRTTIVTALYCLYYDCELSVKAAVQQQRAHHHGSHTAPAVP
jgi:hypothetical protein